MSHDVFLSYSRKDERIAEAARAALERRGLRVWIDNKSISGGSDWAGAIVGGLNSSKVMVLIFSKNANASANVRREVERAVSKNMALIPFRIDGTQPSDAFELFLSLPQWVDANVGAPEHHLDKLCAAVRAAMDAAAKQKPSAPRPAALLASTDAAPPSKSFPSLTGGRIGALAAGALVLLLGTYFLHHSEPPISPPPVERGDGSHREEKASSDASDVSRLPYVCHETTEDCSTFSAAAPIEGPMSTEAGVVKINGVEVDVEGLSNASTLALRALAESLAKTKTIVSCVRKPSGAYRCVTVGGNDDLASLLTRTNAKRR